MNQYIQTQILGPQRLRCGRWNVLSSKYTFHKGCVVVDGTYCTVNIRSTKVALW